MSFCKECNTKVDDKFALLLKNHFTPKMIAIGWQGSGLHYRKILENSVIQVFSIETSWANTSAKTRQIKCRTGIHFTFLPDVERIRALCCYFNNELSPSRPEPRFIWNYSIEENENIEMLNSIWYEFQKHASYFYDDFNSFPHPFDKIRPEDFDSNIANNILGEYNLPIASKNLVLLRDINTYLGNKTYANSFVELIKKNKKEIEMEKEEFKTIFDFGISQKELNEYLASKF